MHYTPHILQKRTTLNESYDEFGRPIPDDNIDEWVDVCQCRCDHNGDKQVKMPDGTVIMPEYRVILPGYTEMIKTGDYVRCVKEDGSVRGEGFVVKSRTLNYLPYAEIFVQV